MSITSIDAEGLYSLNGEEPIQLPNRIRFENGLTKTDISTFTIEDLESVGFSGPYDRPSIDSNTQEIFWDSESLSFIVNDIQFEKPSPEELLEAKNQNATFLLRKCDWTQLPDAPLSASEVEDWVTYRQAVRDFSDSITSIQTVEEYEALSWPKEPNLV